MDAGDNTSSPSDKTQADGGATSAASHPGCGCTSPSSPSTITVRVTPTTGGQFDLQVARNESVENLKKLISKKLKVPKERICLLHRDRQLRDGTLQENQLMDGSRLTLLPSVETGLLAQRPEQSVMQALESLNDSQVNDFLSGKAPLNLTMRLGDHMMLIQLQLSTVTPSVARRHAASSSSSSTASSSKPPTTATTSSSSHQRSRAAATSTVTSTSSSAATNTTTTSTTTSTSSSSSAAAPATPVFPPPARPCKFFLGKPPPAPPPAAAAATSPLKSLENTVAAAAPVSTSTCKCEQTQTQQQQHQHQHQQQQQQQQAAATAAKPTLDTRALAEASRNLTQTLKQLSSEVLTSRSDPVEDTARARRQGAIIESMHHHGRGVYSGTFSGTLNPALQDRFGRPKRDISTIIHILNDLLCATPQYRRHARQGHTITVEATAPKPTAASSSHSTSTATADKSQAGEDQTEDAANLSPENQATRGKMEHLRLIMEERRARRRARREARVAPYTTQWSAKSESLSQGGVADEPMETEQTAAGAPSSSEPQLCEMNPPEPVVA